jgi:T5SS/PEP-CTERM-associated repeat protein
MKKHPHPTVPQRGKIFSSLRLPAGAALAALACVSAARAADISWDAVAPGPFTTATNWDGDVAPTAADNAIIANGGEAQIGSSDAISITTLQIQNGTVTQTGGSINASAEGEVPGAYYIGSASGQTGTYSVSGGSILTGGRAIIGTNGGTGVFTLSGASNYTGDGGRRTDIGNGAGSIGTLNVLSGSQWTVNDWMIVGRAGTGTLNVSGTDSQVNVNGQFFIGDIGGGVGTATFSNGATVTGSGEFIVGNGGSTGALTITDTAAINSQQFFVGNGGGSTGTYTMQGGTNTSNSWVVVGRSQGNGTASLENNAVWTKVGGGNFAIGDGFGGDSTGVLTIKDTAHLDIQGGELWVGAEGSFASNGTLNVNGGTVDTNNWVSVGRNHTTGTLNITNGTFNVNAVGSFASGPNFTSEGSVDGNAVINQSGGVFNNPASDTILGESGGSVTVWNATGGTATHNVVRIGGNGQGTLNISGSAVVTAPLIYVSSNGGSSGALNVTGGTLNLGHLEAGAGSHTVVFDGGQVNATADDSNFIRDFHTGEVDIQDGGLNVNSGAFTVGISTQLSGVGGIKKTGSGSLIIQLPSDGPQDANTYSGETLVSAGTLEALNTNLGIGNVRVADGAHLILDINTAIGDLANLFLEGDFSTVNLAFGTDTETIGSLVVNGVVVPIGTYTAAQLNGMFDGQFSGTGSLNVTSAAAIPEPSTVALAIVGLGSVLFLRRRRVA